MRQTVGVRVIITVVAALALSLGSAAGARAVQPSGPFDFDGDGFADLTVGVPGESIGSQTLAGAVNVLSGSPGGPVTAGNQFWAQNSPGVAGAAERFDLFGSTVASADFDRDERADLAVGVWQEALGKIGAAGAVSVLVKVGPRRGAGLSISPFPRAASRTRRAPYDATGSPQARFRVRGIRSSGDRPGSGDLRSSVPVPVGGHG